MLRQQEIKDAKQMIKDKNVSVYVFVDHFLAWMYDRFHRFENLEEVRQQLIRELS